MFEWIHKTPMTETLADEINKAICIVVTLAVIGLIGWAVDKWEDSRKK